MKRDAAEIAELSRLIDAALELPPEERATWIENLPAANDTLKPALRNLLTIPPGNNSHTLSDVSRQVHAAIAGAVSVADAVTLAAGARVGPYELMRELGRGGMGAVWLARRTEGLTRRTVALKLPHPGMLHAEFAARMGRERDILESLAHPNIARLYDAGVTAGGQPYLALEYIEGVPINVYCDEKQLGVRERIRLFIQVLQAIQHAHSHLVIHRDLKPANILVTAAGAAVVLDFGIAKLTVEGSTADTALTQFGGRALTPDYASPEQIAGAPLTTASDVYSLGVILYELLTGERPYKLARGSAAALEEAILAADIRRPSQAVGDETKAAARAASPNKLARALRGDLDTIVLTAMRAALNERYRTADALTVDIQQYLDGRAINARPESWWEGARRFVLRHKLVVGSAVAVTLALAVGLSTALWQRRIAQLESANQKASKEFVIGLFESVAENTPQGLSPADATAKQMLDLGTRKLFAEHSADSQVRLDLLILMASLNDSLDLLDAGLKAADEAVGVARRLYGERDLRYAEALEAKAEVLVRKGDFTQATAVADNVLTALGPANSANSAVFARTHILLGNVHNQIDPPESKVPREHLELALKSLKAAGAHSADLSRAGFYLARTLESAGDYAGAEPYYVDAIKAAEQNFGAGTYLAAFGYDNFGDMLRHVHRYAEAEKYVRAAATTYQALYGPEHANVSMTNINLGLILAAEGKRAEADQRMNTAITSLVASRGPDDRVVSYFRLHRARATLAMGQLETARSLHDATLSSPYAKDPANLRQILITGVEQAQILILLNRLDEAAGYLNAAAAGFKGTSDTGTTRDVRLLLREGELAHARHDAAGAQYPQQALDLVLKLGENASDALPETLFSYTQQLPTAPLARQTLTRLESQPLIKTVRSGGALSVDEAIQLHTALGRLEQAAGDLPAARKDLDAALALRTKYDDPASPWVAQLQGMMAEYFLQAGDPARARGALARAEGVRSAAALPWFAQPLAQLRARLPAN
ncbi:MAG: serine/threonine-protein kinase [Pseudomonadota bacterium]